MDISLIFALVTGIALLLALILWVKVQAFLSLLIASITTGLLAGLSPHDVLLSIHKGMGSTLGFIATVVGLGAIFGAILEHSGGALALSSAILKKTGERNASWALMISGFLIAIPVFFDVAFIILIPVIFSLQKKTGKSLLLYALPLLAGLAVAHSFIPPTPGPVAVAEMLQADLGKTILAGILTGIPAAIIGGVVYAKFISKKVFLTPSDHPESDTSINLPSASLVLSIILIPLFLIIVNTVCNSDLISPIVIPNYILEILGFTGHPFIALIIANLFAWYLLGIKMNFTREKLMKLSTHSLAPAGIIILITGAGGVYKQVLSDTEAGKLLANSLTEYGLSPILFAFVTAGIIRVLQGSATVAMITSAGMTAAILETHQISEWEKALLVIAIASGATMVSHVNDSGFWLVGKYLGLSEKQTLRTWTISTTLIGLTGLIVVLLLSIWL